MGYKDSGMLPTFQGFVSLLVASHIVSYTQAWPASEVIHSHGHYPHNYCTFTHAYFSWENRTFYYRSKENKHSNCGGVTDIWQIANKDDITVHCDVTYDYGYAFTIYATYGGNYFHLHYDMMIPLYSAVYHQAAQQLKTGTKIFMPTIESSRLQSLMWDTPLFQDESKYWNQLTKSIVGDNAYQPLDTSLLQQRKTICFKELNFGTKHTQFYDHDVIRGFVRHIKHQLGVGSKISVSTEVPRVGIISRSSRRKILNEEELVSALQSIAEVELVKFEGLTFKEQVDRVQRYTVLAGINGAGLMNCIYLPPSSTCVQMVPYKAMVNWKEYGNLLRARGPYHEWHNLHADLTRQQEHDKYNNRPDTVVHVEEFKQVVEEAIMMARKAQTGKDEL